MRDLTGQKFGRLTVREMGPKNARSQRWLCDCECGAKTCSGEWNLLYGRSTSCGCNAIKLLGDEASLRALYSDYKTGAKSRGLIFDVSLEDFRALTSKDCVYCGAVPSKFSRARKGTKISYVYNGVDRIDNTIGYTKENCAPCCSICNRMKFKFGAEDFIEHARRIAEFNA